jgi:hypothetical protein
VTHPRGTLPLQLRRLEVKHVRGDDVLFSDDVMLSGRLVLHADDAAIVITPCSDVATMLADLATRREIATATLLLRPVTGLVGTTPTVTLRVLRPGRAGVTEEIAELTCPTDQFDANLRQLAGAARVFADERGERMLVDDLTPLAQL